MIIIAHAHTYVYRQLVKAMARLAGVDTSALHVVHVTAEELCISFSFYIAITITAVQQLYTVREDVGYVEICFRVTQGIIEGGTDIHLFGNSMTMDGTANGTFNIFVS